MLTQGEFIRKSLELNLFFLRIVKEHLIFGIASLPPKNKELIATAGKIKENIENLLAETVSLSNGIISQEVKLSSELVTPFTLMAEKATVYFTGIPINTRITEAEAALMPGAYPMENPVLYQRVCLINQKALALDREAILAQKQVLNAVSECKVFTFLYPSQLDHVIEEAEMYSDMLQKLQRGEVVDTPLELANHEAFWNHIMGEHAMFIRGYLDPSEEMLINKSNAFANIFIELERKAKEATAQLALLPRVTSESYNATREIREFKAQGTKGGLECKIKSIILPLLNDHVLREASYYLRLLSRFEVSKTK